MAGVARFDRGEVLDRAARVFWRQGYDATSIQDLEAATSLGRGSLYNAFGDKAALFRAVLVRYGETEGAAPLCHLGDPDVLVGLTRMLHAIVERMRTSDRPRGCLITNTCIAGGGGMPTELQIAENMRAMEALFEAAFVRARDSGQIADTVDPLRLSRFYCGIVQSLGVMHRALGDCATLNDIVTVALSKWPYPDKDRNTAQVSF
ncbi:TetR/AcrR family transcriptional regulator [Sphingomonas sp. PAMC 26605]|uniref:TetR/AcrR family transcriptional regulator n=1 Tax=Sphingomonas sp. PAMC 26605 TaxID=1112214 RepID=UPI001E62A150|nr:TetR/AcrR family transcriptional regulator [Sphingomonas sp. PAMC 26605]